VVSAPSGAGKTTVCRAAVERDPEIVFSVSHTTRPRREGERDGLDYHFVSEREFRRLVEQGAFLEYAEYSGRLYGTSWAALEGPLARGCDVLLEIDTQGARQVRERLAEAPLVFLLPPSLAELEQRLRGRGTDRPEAIERRLALAGQELRAARWFDYLVVNDTLEAAVQALLCIVRAVRDGDPGSVMRRFGREVVLARLDPALAAHVRG
jgi:guanylate kinase